MMLSLLFFLNLFYNGIGCISHFKWGRYADYPAARGRALMMIFIKMLPYMIATPILKLMKQIKMVNTLKTKCGEKFSTGLLKLGPLYIKIGQILSCREKLLPEEWVTALERLQDRVPAKTGQDARELAYSAFGSRQKMEEILEDFDDIPLAAASLGQVHVATLRSNVTQLDEASTKNEYNINSGKLKVAIKIQRARLKDIYDKDLVLMKKIAKVGDKITSLVGGVQQNWTDIFNDAEVILYREIDYRKEAENAKRFAMDFGIGLNGTKTIPSNSQLPSASEWLRTPYIYEHLSSEKILIQEYVPSIKINDFVALEAANITSMDRTYLAQSLARSYLRQFCSSRFFSTDPHPGNLGVEIPKVDGEKPKLVFYDFGQACSLRKDQADGILAVIEGIMDLDASACVRAFDQMGVLLDYADLDIVTRKVQENFDTGKIKIKKSYKNEGSLQKLPGDEFVTKQSGIDNEINSNDDKLTVKDSDVMPYFTLPAEYAFVARALSQLDGVGKGLDPEFDFISAAAPFIVEIKGANIFLREKILRFISDAKKRSLQWETELFKQFGFDAKKYLNEAKRP